MNTYICIPQLKRLAKNLHHLATNATDLEECCVTVKIKPRKMKRSVPTCWNSVAEASACALELKTALIVLWAMPKHDVRMAVLRKYKLAAPEWTILKQLDDVLKVRGVPLLIISAY